MNTVTIETNALKALMLFAAKDDVRYYLKGVYMETGKGGARLVATNGHVLVMHFIPGMCAVSDGIVSGELIANALKISGKTNALDILVAPGAERPTYTIAGLSEIGIDGRYPDVMRVLPTGEPSGQAAQFEAEYVALFGKAATLLTKKKRGGICIAHNGASSAAVVDVGREDFFGVIMPARSDGGSRPVVPDWATKAIRPAVASAAAE